MPDYMTPELTLYLAGERVVAGSYRRIDAEVTVHLEQEDLLPASLDGQVACYSRMAPTQHKFSGGAAAAKTELKIQGDSNVLEDTCMR